MINTVYSDGTPTISLAYNRAGRQTRAEDAVGVTTFRYDEFGSLTNETVIGVAGTNTIIRHWDNFGRSLGYSLVGVPEPKASREAKQGRAVTRARRNPVILVSAVAGRQDAAVAGRQDAAVAGRPPYRG